MSLCFARLGHAVFWPKEIAGISWKRPSKGQRWSGAASQFEGCLYSLVLDSACMTLADNQLRHSLVLKVPDPPTSLPTCIPLPAITYTTLDPLERHLTRTHTLVQAHLDQLLCHLQNPRDLRPRLQIIVVCQHSRVEPCRALRGYLNR